MLVSVRPAVDRGATRVSMVVLGRTAEDIDEFIEKLEATGAFEKILATQKDRTDDGLNRAVLDAVYAPDQAEAKPADDAKPGERRKPANNRPPIRRSRRTGRSRAIRPSREPSPVRRRRRPDRAGARGIVQAKLAEAES